MKVFRSLRSLKKGVNIRRKWKKQKCKGISSMSVCVHNIDILLTFFYWFAHVMMIVVLSWILGGSENPDSEEEYSRTAQASWVQRMFTSLFSDSALFNTREGRAGKVHYLNGNTGQSAFSFSWSSFYHLTRCITSCWAWTWTPASLSLLWRKCHILCLHLKRKWML